MVANDDILIEVTRRLVEKFHPVKVIVFGSQAREAANEQSDVDLIVLCESFANRNELEAEMYACLRGVPFPVDLLVYTPEEFEAEKEIAGTVAQPASREGKVVYERAA